LRTGGGRQGLRGMAGTRPGTLRARGDRLNRLPEQGEDTDFHRGEDPYGRFFLGASTPQQCLRPVGGDRLHAVRLVLGDRGTKGGAVIDANGAVVDVEGQPIAGLYAAGNSSASIS